MTVINNQMMPDREIPRRLVSWQSWTGKGNQMTAFPRGQAAFRGNFTESRRVLNPGLSSV